MYSLGSSVSIVPDYRLDEWGLNPGRGKGFFSLASVLTSSEAHLGFQPMGTRGKAWPGCDTDHSPPSSTEVKNELELNLLFPLVPAWHSKAAFYFYNNYFIEEFAVQVCISPSIFIAVNANMKQTFECYKNRNREK
jgi:hypothetical protein